MAFSIGVFEKDLKTSDKGVPLFPAPSPKSVALPLILLVSRTWLVLGFVTVTMRVTDEAPPLSSPTPEIPCLNSLIMPSTRRSVSPSFLIRSLSATPGLLVTSSNDFRTWIIYRFVVNNALRNISAIPSPNWLISLFLADLSAKLMTTTLALGPL